MTNQSFTHKLTRPLVITLLAAVAVPALISAPSAYGGERVKARNSNNTYQSDRAHGKRKAQRHNKSNVQRERKVQRQNRPSVQREHKVQRQNKSTAQRERNWREDRQKNRGDWSNDRARQQRLERAERTQRANRTHRSDRTTRTDRTRRSTSDHRTHRTRRASTDHRRNNRHSTSRTHRDNNRHSTNRSRSHNNRQHQRQSRRNHNYRPHHNTGWNNRYNGFRTSYRSSLGISFFFGQAGYSRYRWAPSRYSFYQPGYMSYSNYQSSTYCDRILIDGYHNGHTELVSVLQCTNPYDGTYIVQGTEQVVNCNFGTSYYSPYYRP
ncbi:MAG: hypothetical protein COB92_05150 [Robiginitomaculum sp.]|nr:MAG: hypothetical protein COB92_05150 [Robiginitomaculum sp.]